MAPNEASATQELKTMISIDDRSDPALFELCLSHTLQNLPYYMASPKYCKEAFEAMESIMKNNADLSKRILQESGLSLISNAIRTNRDDEDISRQGLKIVWMLISKFDGWRDILIECFIKESIMAINRYPSGFCVVKEALRVLMNTVLCSVHLATNAVSLNVIGAILMVLKQHESNSIIVCFAISVIANISQTNKLADALVNESVHDFIVEAMLRFPRSEAVQDKAALAINKLCRSESIIQTMVDCGAVKPLVAAVEMRSGTPRIRLIESLTLLGYNSNGSCNNCLSTEPVKPSSFQPLTVYVH